MAISRRTALKTLGAVPAVVGLTWTPAEAEEAHAQATQARKATHRYGRTGTFTVRVSATDRAGNATAVERRITIGGKK